VHRKKRRRKRGCLGPEQGRRSGGVVGIWDVPTSHPRWKSAQMRKRADWCTVRTDRVVFRGWLGGSGIVGTVQGCAGGLLDSRRF
jgi:hypothetical protein